MLTQCELERLTKQWAGGHQRVEFAVFAAGVDAHAGKLDSQRPIEDAAEILPIDKTFPRDDQAAFKPGIPEFVEQRQPVRLP